MLAQFTTEIFGQLLFRLDRGQKLFRFKVFDFGRVQNSVLYRGATFSASRPCFILEQIVLIVIEYHSNFVSVINGHLSFWSVKYTYIVGGQTLGSVTTFLGRNHMNLFRKFKSI